MRNDIRTPLSTLALIIAGMLVCPHVSAQQKNPPQYRITLWMIRPVAKKLPSVKQFNKGLPSWALLRPNDNFAAPANDSALLQLLQRKNPAFNIPRIERKISVVIPADNWSDISSVPSLTFKIRIHDKDAESSLRKAWPVSNPEKLRELRKAMQGHMVVEENCQIRGERIIVEPEASSVNGTVRAAPVLPFGSANSMQSQTTYHVKKSSDGLGSVGFILKRPNTVVILNPGISMGMTTSANTPRFPGANHQRVYQQRAPVWLLLVSPVQAK